VSGQSAPLATVEAWAEAWRHLDHVAISALFTDDATYVGALSGELRELPRTFAIATRTWRECAVDQLDATLDAEVGSLAAARASYTFSGTTRHGTVMAYEAAATFVLRRLPAESDWRILRFQESYRKGAAPG
jgi:ketosteroid isomerase-like protein